MPHFCDFMSIGSERTLPSACLAIYAIMISLVHNFPAPLDMLFETIVHRKCSNHSLISGSNEIENINEIMYYNKALRNKLFFSPCVWHEWMKRDLLRETV